MNWQSVLNDMVYPALAGLLFLILSIALRALALWLKAQASKIQNDLLKDIVLSAVNGVEQQASVAEKTGHEKWTSDLKKVSAAGVALKTAETKGIKVTEAEIGHLIESVLGEKI